MTKSFAERALLVHLSYPCLAPQIINSINFLKSLLLLNDSIKLGLNRPYVKTTLQVMKWIPKPQKLRVRVLFGMTLLRSPCEREQLHDSSLSRLYIRNRGVLSLTMACNEIKRFPCTFLHTSIVFWHQRYERRHLSWRHYCAHAASSAFLRSRFLFRKAQLPPLPR